MKCHYEVLEVTRDANSDDVKKAYRRLAVKWHPDKNLENTEEATEQFKLIQQAFEVLSDPHERAWYDDHREAILKGKGGDYSGDDESLDVYQYFTPSCYQGFSDDEKGFYAVYREVFNKIAAEDSEYQRPGEDEDSDFEIPSFGKSDSPYDEVKQFYNYWQSYCTKKSYSWLDPYDIRQAPNRRVVRLMEKDNKKVRDKARKARNLEVQELVKFVYKRDKRVQAHAEYLQKLSAEKAKKSEEKRREKIKERKSELASYKESDWSKFSNFENELKDIEANIASEFGDPVSSENSDNEEDVADHNLYCVACNKLFKTSKAFQNHESSKKHKENVLMLKQEMAETDDENLDINVSDNESLNDVSDDGSNGNSFQEDNEEDCVEVNESIKNNDDYSDNEFKSEEIVDREPLFCIECNKLFKTEKAVKDHMTSQNHIKNSKLYKEIIQNLGSDTEEDDNRDSVNDSCSDNGSLLDDIVSGDSNLKEHLDKIMSKFTEFDSDNDKNLHNDIEKICAEFDDILTKNKKLEAEEEKMKSVNRSKKKNKTKQPAALLESDEDDFDFSMGQSKKQKRKQQNRQQVLSKSKEKNSKPRETNTITNDENKKLPEEEHTNSQESTLADNKKLESQTEGETSCKDSSVKPCTVPNKSLKKKKDKNLSVSNSSDASTTCAVCQSIFPSKNKLFQHLTKTGHSTYIPELSNKKQEIDKNSSKKGKNKKKIKCDQ